jgi:hypothetical protein
MINVLRLHAEAGPIWNEQKSRELWDSIYEFKTTQGARLLYFYAPGGMTILTHGFHKGGNLKVEVQRAKEMRATWEASAP